MRFVLLIGHGSRDENGNEEIRDFARGLISHRRLVNTEVCFLEFGQPDIAKGIAACVSRGATDIIAIPVILLPAGHSKVHIPEALDRAKLEYPSVRFRYGTPVGTDSRILDILDERLGEIYDSSKMLPRETSVILAGRGSSDPDANSTLSRIARLFWERHRFYSVETAFMGITEPLVPEVIERCLRLGVKNILIVPYFLFTGILIDRMKTSVRDFAKANPDHRILVSGYFGCHRLLEDIILKKIDEAEHGISDLNCDLCHFRQGHSHDHNHDHKHHGHDHHHGHSHHH